MIATTAPNVIEVLRGDPASRPPVDTASAARLRGVLEEGVRELLGDARARATIVVRPSTMRRVAGLSDVGDSTIGSLRGILVGQLLRLRVVGTDVEAPFDDAVAAWRSDGPSVEMSTRFNELDPNERARLATDVTAHFVTLERALDPLPRRWVARSSVSAVQLLNAGRVVLRDRLDLVIGSNAGPVASVVLVDLTTSPLGAGAERLARYHALVETLRTSRVPLRTAAFSTATGELWVREVDHELLALGALDVLDAIEGARE